MAQAVQGLLAGGSFLLLLAAGAFTLLLPPAVDLAAGKALYLL